MNAADGWCSFVSAEEAKPKVPHKNGRVCLSCGATEASQWRGPGGNYCSVGKCKTEAKEASERMRNTAAPLAEQVTALKSEVHELHEQVDALDTKVEKQEARLEEQEEALAAMRRHVAHLAHQCSFQRNGACDVMNDRAGHKRQALADLPPRIQLPR